MHKFDAIIFAAGRGERLGELGRLLAKGLLPVWRDRDLLEPIILRVLRQTSLAGARHTYIILNHRQDQLRRIVQLSSVFNPQNITFIDQPTLDGEAGGLFYIPPQVYLLLQ
jgi:dTDP-glucose pyrophosphorylase